MPDWFDTPNEILVVLTIASVILGGLMWLMKAVNSMQKEFRPNHGSSLKDALDRIERHQEHLVDEVDGIQKKLYEQHERMFDHLGKVHRRMDDHLREDHLRSKQ